MKRLLFVFGWLLTLTVASGQVISRIKESSKEPAIWPELRVEGWPLQLSNSLWHVRMIMGDDDLSAKLSKDLVESLLASGLTEQALALTGTLKGKTRAQLAAWLWRQVPDEEKAAQLERHAWGEIQHLDLAARQAVLGELHVSAISWDKPDDAARYLNAMVHEDERQQASALGFMEKLDRDGGKMVEVALIEEWLGESEPASDDLSNRARGQGILEMARRWFPKEGPKRIERQTFLTLCRKAIAVVDRSVAYKVSTRLEVAVEAALREEKDFVGEWLGELKREVARVSPSAEWRPAMLADLALLFDVVGDRVEAERLRSLAIDELPKVDPGLQARACLSLAGCLHRDGVEGVNGVLEKGCQLCLPNPNPNLRHAFASMVWRFAHDLKVDLSEDVRKRLASARNGL